MKSNSRILVVDDEPGIRAACQRVLEPADLQVDLVGSIAEAVRMISTEDYDLVLLDVMMPDGRGIELLGTIQKKDPDIVSVIITGYATVELAVEAIKRGAYDFIAKPFTADQLLMTVNRGLERRHLSIEAKRLQAAEQNAIELARAKEEMERIDRFKSEFMLMVAHELRSPVGGAQSLLRTLIKGLVGDLTPEQSDILQRVIVRLDSLLELINDLLTLAAGKAVDFEQPLDKIELRPILQTVIDRYQVEAVEKDIRLTSDLSDENLAVLASEEGLEKTFTNLIVNAIKYTPPGGNVQINLRGTGQNAEISIHDSGIGIPRQDLERIGEEFFRAGNVKKSEIPGTGLGLSIVKSYIDRFGGQMIVESSVGKGSKFTVILPIG